jgi:hypothetical protein
MKNLPIGIQDFEKIRNEDFHYVDKTEQYYKIFNDGSCFFLSRPRRFGKSLMLSTLKCLYEGRKELFKGLWIEDKWDWSKTHPVIHVDLSKINTKKNTLEAGLMTQMETCAESFNIKLEYKDAATCFQQLIHQLGKGLNICVVLVDEYDKPITDYINDPEIAKNHIEELKAFYGMLKSSDPYLHKVVVTGVSIIGCSTFTSSIFSTLGFFSSLITSSLGSVLASPDGVGGWGSSGLGELSSGVSSSSLELFSGASSISVSRISSNSQISLLPNSNTVLPL